MNDLSSSTTRQGMRFLNEIDTAVAALERERVEERAALERDLEEEMRGRRSLAEAAIEWLHAGDALRVHVGIRSWAGTLVHVGRELMCLASDDDRRVDIAFAGLTKVEVELPDRCRRGLALARRHPATLVARLRELSVSHREVEVGGRDLAHAVHGSIAAVGPEHVEVETKRGLVVLPFQVIAWVAERESGSVRL